MNKIEINLQPMIDKWKEKLKEAYEQSEYFHRKAREQDDEIRIIIEAIRRLEVNK